jgi:hypothetical protein
MYFSGRLFRISGYFYAQISFRNKLIIVRMKWMKKLTYSLFFSLSSIAAAITGNASLIVDFNSPTFNTGGLNGQNGWTVSSPADVSVVNGGLSYSNGSVVHNGGGQKLSLLGGDNSRASIALPTTYTAGSTFYFSFLFEHNSGDNFLWFAFAGGAADDNGSIAAIAQNVADGGGQPRLRPRVRDAAGGQTTNGGTAAYNLGNNTTRLIVGKVEFNGTSNSTMTLWLDPTSTLESAAPTPTVATRNMNITALDTLWIRKGGNLGNGFVDMIIVGDTFSAVVIPEPRVYASIAGLLALGVVLIRRRRK